MGACAAVSIVLTVAVAYGVGYNVALHNLSELRITRWGRERGWTLIDISHRPTYSRGRYEYWATFQTADRKMRDYTFTCGLFSMSDGKRWSDRLGRDDT